MKNFLLKKSVRDELERRGITYAEYMAEQNAPRREAAEARVAGSRQRAKEAAAAREDAAAGFRQSRDAVGDEWRQHQEERQAARHARQEAPSPAQPPAPAAPPDPWKAASKRTRFPTLRVGVADGTVYTITSVGMKNGTLGPLTGAVAEVTDGTSRHTLTRVVTVAGAFTKKTRAAAFVMAGDGTLRETKLEGASQVRHAQAEAVQFNALVAAAQRG